MTHEDTTLTPGRTRLILAVVGLALMAVVSAVAGLNVALPSLARETGASQTDLTWIVDAYTVVFAGLLLFAGALGDRFGRRLLLAIGLVVFGTAAAIGMVATEPGQLIAIRAAMGVGAAAIMPTTLSVITTSFPERERPRAIGVWVGIAGGERCSACSSPARSSSSSPGSRSSASTSRSPGSPWSACSPWFPAPPMRSRRPSTGSAPCCRSPRSAGSCSGSSRGPSGAGTTR